MARKYDVVFLDAQGTLLRANPSTAAVYAEVCRRFGGSATEAGIAAAVRAQWAELRASVDPATVSFDTSDEITRQWWTGFNCRMFRQLGMQDPRDDFLDALWEAFGSPDNWELFAEVEEVLAELKARGYRLGIVSNWDSRLIAICQKLRLSSYTDFVVASAPAGMEKPDRRIFEIALARTGVGSDRALHVGDDFEADVLGARGAGIEAILIDRDGHPPAPVTTIHSLRELLPLLP